MNVSLDRLCGQAQASQYCIRLIQPSLSLGRASSRHLRNPSGMRQNSGVETSD